MEIEKKRETSWRIQLNENLRDIEITSVEVSGEVRSIKLALLNGEKISQTELNKEEFFNFLSILSAFKDVVIGEETFFVQDDLDDVVDETIRTNQDEDIEKEDDLYEEEPKEDFSDNYDTEELDPEEWDPW